MKKRLSILSIALTVAMTSFTIVPAMAQNQPLIIPAREMKDSQVYQPDDLKYLREERIQSVLDGIKLAKKSGDKIWPNYDISKIPIVIHIPDEEAFLFNYGSPLPEGFEPLKDYPGVAVSKKKLKFPRGISIELPIGNKTGVSVEFKHDFGVAFHEAFHYYQKNTNFQGAKTIGERELTTSSAKDLALAEIEQYLLSEALMAKDKKAMLGKVNLFLAVRQERYKELSNFERKKEENLEAIEGTANYVEKRLAVIAGKPAKRVLALGLKQSIDQFTYKRGRFYETGAALGFILDRLSPQWKKDIQSIDNNLTTLLTKAARFEKKNQARLYEKSMAYAFKMQVRQVSGWLQSVKQMEQELLTAFEQSEGQKVTVLVPSSWGGFSSSSSQEVNLSEKETLFGVGTKISIEKEGLSLLIKDEVLFSFTNDGYAFTFFTKLGSGDYLRPGKKLELKTANATLVSANTKVSLKDGVVLLTVGEMAQ